MPRMLLGINGAGGPFTAEIAQLRADVQNLEAFLDHVADSVIYPALARNYDTSGLKTHRGVVKAAVSKRGEEGNVIEIRGGHLTIGVDTAAVPEAGYALDGHRAMKAARGKVFRFWDENGKPIFSKSIRAVPPHEVFYLTDADVEKIQQAALDWVANGG